MAIERGTRLFRTLFISDVHLGARGCQADRLLDFLRYHDAETIYLVGDIVDGWQLRSGWYWPQPHNDVVQKLLRKARKGARVIYLPGNHDEFLRDYYGTHFGGIEVVENAIHEGADGRCYLVVHGDVFDMVVKHARWLALLGDTAYDLAILINRYFNAIRRKLGFSYWSLSQWAKHKVKNAVISGFGAGKPASSKTRWPLRLASRSQKAQSSALRAAPGCMALCNTVRSRPCSNKGRIASMAATTPSGVSP